MMPMHTEKEKRKNLLTPSVVSYHRRWLYVLSTGVFIFILILGGLSAFGEWRLNGDVKLTLDVEHIPTAEYLLEHPIPTPTIREIYFNGDNTHIWIVVSELERDDFCSRFLSNSEIYINGQRVGDLFVIRSFAMSLPGACSFEVRGKFSGLNVVEIQVKENVFSTPFLTHTWAVRIP